MRAEQNVGERLVALAGEDIVSAEQNAGERFAAFMESVAGGLWTKITQHERSLVYAAIVGGYAFAPGCVSVALVAALGAGIRYRYPIIGLLPYGAVVQERLHNFEGRVFENAHALITFLMQRRDHLVPMSAETHALLGRLLEISNRAEAAEGVSAVLFDAWQNAEQRARALEAQAHEDGHVSNMTGPA